MAGKIFLSRHILKAQYLCLKLSGPGLWRPWDYKNKWVQVMAVLHEIASCMQSRIQDHECPAKTLISYLLRANCTIPNAPSPRSVTFSYLWCPANGSACGMLTTCNIHSSQLIAHLIVRYHQHAWHAPQSLSQSHPFAMPVNIVVASASHANSIDQLLAIPQWIDSFRSTNQQPSHHAQLWQLAATFMRSFEIQVYRHNSIATSN